jgi:HemK-like putative methylase
MVNVMQNEEQWILNEKWNGEKTEGFFADCARLKAGEPLAYIIGSIPFLHTTIFLDSRPLIPRTETEYWVEKIITDIKNRRGPTPTIPLKVLDLCAGSGCIGVSTLAQFPSATVDFVEIDTRHHETIQKNCIRNHIAPERYSIMGGSLFESVTRTYDYILANPPYIDKDSTRVSSSVRVYEPEIALFSDDHGLYLITKILTQAPLHLNKQGVLIIEHDPEQTTAMHTIGHQYGLSGITFKDQYNLDRYTRFDRTQS